MAAAGAAVAFYFYTRKLKVCGFGGNPEDGQDSADQHFEGAYQAPSTWIEALYFFAEALRSISLSPSTLASYRGSFTSNLLLEAGPRRCDMADIAPGQREHKSVHPRNSS